MRIVLVGNGFHPTWDWDGHRNLSSDIDAADIVIRCNGCKYYYHGWTGWKTTTLIVRGAADQFGRRLAAEYDITIPPAVASQASTIVCVSTGSEEANLQPLIARYGWTREQIVILNHHEASSRVSGIAGLSRDCMPTLGAIAIQYCREQYPDDSLELIGFVWEPADSASDKKVHDWSGERAWIYRLVADGAVKLLS